MTEGVIIHFSIPVRMRKVTTTLHYYLLLQLLVLFCCESDDLVHVIVLCGFVSAERAAFSALMVDDKSLFRVGFSGDGVHYSLATCRAVTRVDVQVQR